MTKRFRQKHALCKGLLHTQSQKQFVSSQSSLNDGRAKILR